MFSLKEIQTIKNQEEYGKWSRNGDLEWQTESLLLAAQKQALTNSVRNIFHKDVSNKCRLCGIHVENVLHIVSGCSMLAQKEYKRRLNKGVWTSNGPYARNME